MTLNQSGVMQGHWSMMNGLADGTQSTSVTDGQTFLLAQRLH